MDEKTEMLHDLCKTLTKELDDINEKISRAGGMSAGDLETVDKLSHALKSIKTTIAMMEADGGYSGRYMPYYGGSYDSGRSYVGDGRGGSYARGRSYRRDSMGRYSRAEDGLSDIVDQMRGMMDSLPDDKRREVQRFVDKMDH